MSAWLLPALALVPPSATAALLAGAFRGARRRRRLNAALHELRRPLQSIAIALEGTRPDPGCARACLEQARSALADLDAEINRRERASVPALLQVSDLMAALERRWRFAAVEVSSPPAAWRLVGDPARIGAALDNLVANALQHGGGAVRVRAAERAGEARFEVQDRGPGADAAPLEGDTRRDPRHGHGLQVVRAVAAAHGGRAQPPQRVAGGVTVAALGLPSRRPSR